MEKKRMIKEYVPNEDALLENRKMLPEMETVAKLQGNEFGKGEKALVEQVEEFFNSVGSMALNDVLGDIELNRSGIKDSYSHGIGRLKAIAFKGIPYVLEKGVVIDYDKNHKGRNYDTVIIAAPIDIAGTRRYVAAVVMRNTEPSRNYRFQRYRLHEVFIEGKTSELFKSVANFLQNNEHSNPDVANNIQNFQGKS
jgi:hypothetical protein